LALEHHCPWNEETCSRAAEYGHLEVLKWAIEHGCPGGEEYEYLLKRTLNHHRPGFKPRHEAQGSPGTHA